MPTSGTTEVESNNRKNLDSLLSTQITTQAANLKRPEDFLSFVQGLASPFGIQSSEYIDLDQHSQPPDQAPHPPD